MKYLRTLMPLLGLAAALAAPQAQAAVGDDFFVMNTGDLIIRFEGSDAGYNSLIRVNSSPEIFPNHSTPIGTEFNLGSFAAGTKLDVVLHVLNTGLFFHTGNGIGNIDAMAHANVFTDPTGRTFVSFEDLAGGGDMDFNDHVFSFATGTVGVIPEPSSLMLTLAGLGVLGFLLTRLRNEGS